MGSKPQGREGVASTYGSKVIEIAKIILLVERLVNHEESLYGIPRQVAELASLTSRNDGELGRLHVYPGLGGHTEQLAGRHEKVRLPLFVTFPR